MEVEVKRASEVAEQGLELSAFHKSSHAGPWLQILLSSTAGITDSFFNLTRAE